MDFIYTKEIIASKFENDKYALPIYLPFIEQCINNSKWLGTCLYKEKVLSELEKFKQAIGYDAIRKEVYDDINLMYTDPNKLDEKFKIVRDKYGREISRGGIANPYYISLKEADDMEEYYLSIEDDEVKMREFNEKLVRESVERIENGEVKVSSLAKKRLEEILSNPTANFYEKCGYASQIDDKKEQKYCSKLKK